MTKEQQCNVPLTGWDDTEEMRKEYHEYCPKSKSSNIVFCPKEIIKRKKDEKIQWINDYFKNLWGESKNKKTKKKGKKKKKKMRKKKKTRKGKKMRKKKKKQRKKKKKKQKMKKKKKIQKKKSKKT